jgi:uncharacterized phage protein (TIGR02218 family)
MASIDMSSLSKGGISHLARCWKVIRRDGEVMGLTDHDADIQFDGVTFHANAGMIVSRLEKRLGFDDHGLDISGVLSHPIIRDIDLEEGLYDDADFSVWLVDWADANNRQLIFAGILGEVAHDGTSYRFSIRPNISKLEQVEGLVYQRSCSATLGDARCGLDLSQNRWRYTVQVSRIHDYSLEVQGFNQATGWFKNGRLLLADRYLRIRDDSLRGAAGAADSVLVLGLWDQVPASLSLGQSVVIEQGCDQAEETCRNRFGNYINFRGFANLPTPQVLVQIKRAR